jgi:hypothetical protein
MPTQAEAAYSPSVLSTPDGAEGVGTVNFPDTALKVCPVGGEVMAIPLQFLLYVTFEEVAVWVLNFVFEFVESFAFIVEP